MNKCTCEINAPGQDEDPDDPKQGYCGTRKSRELNGKTLEIKAEKLFYDHLMDYYPSVITNSKSKLEMVVYSSIRYNRVEAILMCFEPDI